MNGARGARMPSRRSPPWRRWAWAGVMAVAGHAWAQQPASPPSCVDVSINQHAVLAFDCLSRALSPAPAATAARTMPMDSVVGEPSNRQVGQYNFSALSHRMGSNLGKSVLPQRPPPSYPAPPAVSLPAGH